VAFPSGKFSRSRTYLCDTKWDADIWKRPLGECHEKKTEDTITDKQLKRMILNSDIIHDFIYEK
jgi:hypothetical protein